MHRIHCAGIFVYGFVLLMSEAIRCFVTLVTRVSKIIHTVLNKTVTATEFFGRSWVYKRVFLTLRVWAIARMAGTSPLRDVGKA